MRVFADISPRNCSVESGKKLYNKTFSIFYFYSL